MKLSERLGALFYDMFDYINPNDWYGRGYDLETEDMIIKAKELEQQIEALKTQLRTIVSTGETAYFLDSVDLPLAVAKELQEAEEVLND